MGYEGGRTRESMTTKRTGAPLRPAEASQRVSYLELFFDLALVFALFQLSHLLLQQLHWSGALQALILLLAVWRVWVVTTWSTNLLDPQWPVVQRVVIGTLLGGVVLAAALPQAFGKYGLIFGGVLVAVQVGRELFVVAALRGSDVYPVAERALLWSVVSAAPWITGAFTHASARAALWTLAVAIDYAALALAFLRRGATGPAPISAPPVAAEHLAERYRQVFIIALGELILVSGLALSGGGFAPDRTTAFVVSMATTVQLWRIYIYRAGEVLSAAITALPISARLNRGAAYVHLAMVAGVVVTAVGDDLVIAHPLGRTPTAWAIVVLGGPLLFLAGRAGFEYTVFARVSWDRPIGALALAAVTPVALHVPPLLTATAAAAVLVGVAVADAIRDRRRPAGPPSPPARGPS
jgi:low temperature requirement protein LtrA